MPNMQIKKQVWHSDRMREIFLSEVDTANDLEDQIDSLRMGFEYKAQRRGLIKSSKVPKPYL